MANKKLIVGISQGDTNGIGYEVIIKALADPRILDSFTPVIFGSSKAFGFYKKYIHNIGNLDTYIIHSAKDARPNTINILNCIPDNVLVEPGKPVPESAVAAMKSLESAVEALKNGEVDVLVTAPINKKSMQSGNFGFIGHTEYLQSQFGVEDVAMFMVSDRLKIGVVCGHMPIREVAGAINAEKIVSKLRLMKASLQRDFSIDNPTIAVLGLNPHCGDSGLMGDEERTIILPAVRQAQEEGIMAYGPYSADGFFGLGNYSRFDATLAMYHDQGLVPFKALAFEDGVNYTAGLPIVRTSPDHGTAYELAGRDEANPQSMMSSIYMAVDIFRNRIAYDKLLEGKLVEKETDSGEHQHKPGKPQIA